MTVYLQFLLYSLPISRSREGALFYIPGLYSVASLLVHFKTTHRGASSSSGEHMGLWLSAAAHLSPASESVIVLLHQSLSRAILSSLIQRSDTVSSKISSSGLQVVKLLNSRKLNGRTGSVSTRKSRCSQPFAALSPSLAGTCAC